MRSTELVNARLKKVSSPGSTDTYEGETGPGGELWAGDVGVWFEELRDRRSRGAGTDFASDVYLRRELTVSADLVGDRAGQLAGGFKEGQVLELERTRSGELVIGRVQLVDLPDPPPGEQGEVRLVFELS